MFLSFSYCAAAGPSNRYTSLTCCWESARGVWSYFLFIVHHMWLCEVVSLRAAAAALWQTGRDERFSFQQEHIITSPSGSRTLAPPPNLPVKCMHISMHKLASCRTLTLCIVTCLAQVSAHDALKSSEFFWKQDVMCQEKNPNIYWIYRILSIMALNK